jgi:cation diffusion facilitator family transporter
VDASHTYGHEKIEFFSSGLEGILILVAGIAIGWAAIDRLIHPVPELPNLDIGLLLALVASAINFGVAQVLLRVGRKYGSIVMEADGEHVMTDVWSSVGVLVAVGLVWLTGWQVLDPLVALAVAANIAWTALSLIRRSFNGLMDHSLPEEEQARVRAAIESCMDDSMDFHALRTRQAGNHRFADFHLLVPGSLSVKQAHGIANRMEEAIGKALPDIEVTIHIEPIEDRTAQTDNPLAGVEPRREKLSN